MTVFYFRSFCSADFFAFEFFFASYFLCFQRFFILAIGFHCKSFLTLEQHFLLFHFFYPANLFRLFFILVGFFFTLETIFYALSTKFFTFYQKLSYTATVFLLSQFFRPTTLFIDYSLFLKRFVLH